MSKYKAILTTAGAAKIAAASAGGKPLNIDRLAVGDGNGTLPTPNPVQSALINECYRAALNSLTVDSDAPDRLIAELIIPASIGGFWLREMGLYDADGALIAVGNMAESYKPKLEEGSGRTQTLRMVLIVSHTEAVTLIVSGDMVTATRDFVVQAIDEHAKSRNHPDGTTAAKGFVQLSSATNSASETLAATPKAVKAAYDLAAGKLSSVPDATTVAKGIVQLSSAIDSTSETLAATPKAVKAVSDAAVKLNKNLADLPDKAMARVSLGLKAAALCEVGSADGQLMAVGAFGLGASCVVVADANEIGRSGFFGLSAGKHTNSPNVNASWEVLSICYDSGSRKQIFLQAGTASTKTYVRYRTSPGGVWGAYQSYYSTENKPTASDVGALTDEQALQKYALRTITVNGKPLSADVNLLAGDVNAWNKTEADGRYLMKIGGQLTGTLKTNAEIQSTSQNNYRIIGGNYGTFWRNDGSSLYLMMTDVNDPLGGYGSHRPLAVSMATGGVTLGTKVTLTNAEFIDKMEYVTYTDGEARTHRQTNGLRLKIADAQLAEFYYNETVGESAEVSLHNKYGSTDSYLSLKNDGLLHVSGTNPRINFSGGTTFTNDGNIYGSVWGGYLSNYIASQISMLTPNVQAWVYQNYIQGIRLSGRTVLRDSGGRIDLPSGCVYTGMSGSNYDPGIWGAYSAVQILINGQWATVGTV